MTYHKTTIFKIFFFKTLYRKKSMKMVFSSGILENIYRIILANFSLMKAHLLTLSYYSSQCESPLIILENKV